MAANLIGTGLGLRTRGLESGVDLPATGNVLTVDTAGGEAGLYVDPGVTKVYKGVTAGLGVGTGPNAVEGWYIYTADDSDTYKTKFAAGEAIYSDAFIEVYPGPLTDATLLVEVYDKDGTYICDLVAEQLVTIPANSGQWLSVLLGAMPCIPAGLPVGQYYAKAWLTHDRLGYGSGIPGTATAIFGFSVVDLPDISNVVPPDTLEAVTGTHVCSGGGDPPDPAGWADPPCTAGNGQVTLHVVAASPTDVVYARFRRFLPNGEAPWSAESETFKRIGTGNIVITGLTNEQGYELEVYASAGGVMSEWSEPAYCTPTDGSAAMIARVMAAVAAQVNAQGLTDSEGHAVAAAVEIPPEFDEVNTACVKVFPDVETGEPNRGQVNEIRYRVNVAFCERSKTTLQQGTEMLIRERLRDQFLGKRLMGLPEAFCEKETESGIVDVDALWERFQWVSVITFEFVALRARG